MITTPSQADEQEKLPMDFLEFLAEGVVIEDEYLDPLNYADINEDVMVDRGIGQRERGSNKGERATKDQAHEVNDDEK